ncbi:MAG: hypothetical protein KBD73_04105, partial [Candidatus Magasanikbacteria bacterium]|nr:hypothetical protein [Candidatus Magasanikbacteria bacterium]
HLHYEVRDRNTNHSLPIQFVERIPVALVGVVSKNSPPASAQVPDQRPPQTPPEAPIQDVPNTFAFQGLCDSRTTEKQSICLNELDSNQDVLKTMLVNCQEKTSTFCPNICIANSDSASNDFCGLATEFSGNPNGNKSTIPINKNIGSSEANTANCD